MAWGGGGWLIWRNGSLRNSASQPPSRRSAGSCEPWATANYRPDRVTMRKPRARSRILKKLPRAPGGSCAQEGPAPRHDRNLVRRRGPHRPEEQDHPPLGQARHPSKRTAGPTHRFHLHLRCSLPEGGQGCSPDHAGLQHRGDELAPRRDRRNRRARCPRHPPGRPSRLALVHAPPRAGQHHHHSAAAEVPRAQPGRERLAVHARQLALQPHLQILRRSRRPLLCGMEQARRPALAHHVHRTAPMGPRVLINGIWYYFGLEVISVILRVPHPKDVPLVRRLSNGHIKHFFGVWCLWLVNMTLINASLFKECVGQFARLADYLWRRTALWRRRIAIGFLHALDIAGSTIDSWGTAVPCDDGVFCHVCCR